ncbi:MAG: CBS domain-containing protein [Candidatus Acidiferrales bacterium]
MWIPKDLGWMATRLKEGHRVNRITVRDLLRMFKAERRGLNKVNDIRTALDELGLQTEPDFESTWIDGPIKVCLKNGTNDALKTPEAQLDAEDGSQDAEGAEEESDGAEVQQSGSGVVALPPIVVSNEGVVETALSEPPDPTFRIGSLPVANKPLTTVGQDDTLTKAVTKMLQFDYSQLPIMHGEREVKGMISWKSIASRYAIGGECGKVQACREDAQVVDGNGTLFDAIPTIVKHGYVLVRSESDRRITGIVTASDLSLQFQQLAEPFLLLREIELHIRQLLQDKVTSKDLELLGGGDAGVPSPKSINDLSFGGYVRLLQDSNVWAKLSLRVDQASMTSQLEQVRVIRNDVMHFDPDPLTGDQLEVLKNASKFMQQLYELLP